MKKGIHAAIIMDGNGRWAQARGLPRLEGHRAGAESVRRVVEAAPTLGIAELTLYAFSCDNWKRSPGEVSGLMSLFEEFLRLEIPRCVEKRIRFEMVGRRDRLPRKLLKVVEHAESETEGGDRLHLRLAVDYSARWAIQSGAILPDVDLLIRSGGERRLSDFLLWESAYAELIFTPTMWPDFAAEELAAGLREFFSRERRFGAV